MRLCRLHEVRNAAYRTRVDNAVRQCTRLCSIQVGSDFKRVQPSLLRNHESIKRILFTGKLARPWIGDET